MKPEFVFDEDSFKMPGFANVHSHAFQYAIAGLTEEVSGRGDSFWTWRRKMYEAVKGCNPERLRTTASLLYCNMLKMGYTSVGEFHYLHHQFDGEPYDDSSIMSQALLEAAELSGIQLTLLPVLYSYSGFERMNVEDEQRAFYCNTQTYLELLEKLKKFIEQYSEAKLGIAFHSLRAVGVQQIDEVLRWRKLNLADCPVHIHIAEQQSEVVQCQEKYNATPVQYLCDNVELDENWTLIHATHINKSEISKLSESKATIGLCPTTEANLGDGFFPMQRYKDCNGSWALGSDSHVSLNPMEELRWLEYSQRLLKQQRGICVDAEFLHPGEYLVREALRGGEKSIQQGAGMVKLDRKAPLLYGVKSEDMLDVLVFISDCWRVQDVEVAGQVLVEDGEHFRQDQIESEFIKGRLK